MIWDNEIKEMGSTAHHLSNCSLAFFFFATQMFLDLEWMKWEEKECQLSVFALDFLLKPRFHSPTHPKIKYPR